MSKHLPHKTTATGNRVSERVAQPRIIYIITCALIVIVSVIFRFLWLGRLPGINFDEAYLAVQIQHFMRGEEYTLRTPTGLFFGPFLIVSHWVLLRLFQPDFFLLRLPIAFWSSIGLAVFYWLHRRAYGGVFDPYGAVGEEEAISYRCAPPTEAADFQITHGKATKRDEDAPPMEAAGFQITDGKATKRDEDAPPTEAADFQIPDGKATKRDEDAPPAEAAVFQITDGKARKRDEDAPPTEAAAFQITDGKARKRDEDAPPMEAAVPRNICNSRNQSSYALLLYACMPLSLASSRCHWDSSYMLLTAPLVLLPAIRMADGNARGLDLLLLLGGILLSLWIHPSSIVFIGLICLAFILILRRSLWRRLEALHIARRSLLLLALFAIAALGLSLLLIISGRNPHEAAGVAFRGVNILLSRPRDLLIYESYFGDFVGGARAFQFYAGVFDSTLLRGWSYAKLLALITAAIILLRSARHSDRMLGLVWVMLPIALIVTYPMFLLQIQGHERYVLWLLPLAAVSLVRTLEIAASSRPTLQKWNTPIILLVSLFMLGQFWFYYFILLQNGLHYSTLHPTWRTGSVEPKAAVAMLIQQQMAASANPIIYAENSTISQPLRYLLEPKARILTADEKPVVPPQDRPVFLVGFAESGYIQKKMAFWAVQERTSATPQIISTADGRPFLIVLALPPAK